MKETLIFLLAPPRRHTRFSGDELAGGKFDSRLVLGFGFVWGGLFFIYLFIFFRVYLPSSSALLGATAGLRAGEGVPPPRGRAAAAPRPSRPRPFAAAGDEPVSRGVCSELLPGSRRGQRNPPPPPAGRPLPGAHRYRGAGGGGRRPGGGAALPAGHGATLPADLGGGLGSGTPTSGSAN